MERTILYARKISRESLKISANFACVYMYINIRTYVNIHIIEYEHISRHVYIDLFIYVCIYKFAHINIEYINTLFLDPTPDPGLHGDPLGEDILGPINMFVYMDIYMHVYVYK
jgi:hypothetical protein